MTVQELVERDLKKAQINLEKAKAKPNIPLSELEHMEELCRLREKIVELTKASEVAREIFEEIENTITQWIELYYTITVSTFDSIEQAKARASESVLRALRDFIVSNRQQWAYCAYEGGLGCWHPFREFGETVFFTREEAEQALKGARGNEV